MFSGLKLKLSIYKLTTVTVEDFIFKTLYKVFVKNKPWISKTQSKGFDKEKQKVITVIA